MQLRCPRCRLIFTAETLLRDHQRATLPCPLRDGPSDEGFDAAQEKRLRSRKKEQPNMTEDDKWRKVYMILFPNDDYGKMPSPCKGTLLFRMQTMELLTLVDYDEDYVKTSGDTTADAELSRYEAFLQQELPSSIRRELDARVEEALDNTEVNLRSQLPYIFQDMQRRLFRAYLQFRITQQPGRSAITSQQTQDNIILEPEQNGPLNVGESSGGGGGTPNQPADNNLILWDEWLALPPDFDGRLYEFPLDDQGLLGPGDSSTSFGSSGLFSTQNSGAFSTGTSFLPAEFSETEAYYGAQGS
jgi:hypothetical protein